MTPDTLDSHKRGDSYLRYLEIDSSVADGYFVGWTVAAQIRNIKEELIADLDCDWSDPLTTRTLQISKKDTTNWPLASLRWDVQFTRPDGWVISTSNTINLVVTRDETR